MCEIISAADILAEYVSDEGLVTEWPHSSKQDAESVVHYAKLLKAESAAMQKMLESLTPGGSEFSGNPDRCAEWIMDRLNLPVKQQETIAALRRWAKAWKSSARLHLAEAEYIGKEYICMAEACKNEKLRAEKSEAENAALREQLAARERDFRAQDTLLEKIAELKRRNEELEKQLHPVGCQDVWEYYLDEDDGEGVA